MGFGSVIVGYIIKKTSYFKWLTAACCLGPLVAMLLLSTLDESSSTAALWLGKSGEQTRESTTDGRSRHRPYGPGV